MRYGGDFKWRDSGWEFVVSPCEGFALYKGAELGDGDGEAGCEEKGGSGRVKNSVR